MDMNLSAICLPRLLEATRMTLHLGSASAGFGGYPFGLTESSSPQSLN